MGDAAQEPSATGAGYSLAAHVLVEDDEVNLHQSRESLPPATGGAGVDDDAPMPSDASPLRPSHAAAGRGVIAPVQGLAASGESSASTGRGGGGGVSGLGNELELATSTEFVAPAVVLPTPPPPGQGWSAVDNVAPTATSPAPAPPAPPAASTSQTPPEMGKDGGGEAADVSTHFLRQPDGNQPAVAGPGRDYMSPLLLVTHIMNLRTPSYSL